MKPVKRKVTREEAAMVWRLIAGRQVERVGRALHRLALRVGVARVADEAEAWMRREP